MMIAELFPYHIAGLKADGWQAEMLTGEPTWVNP
jgi:hypothetical protein